ncbi:hypothetical protein CAEBREN_12007 [Caenorhabditis brenneri]|uniref:NTF2-like domain-containing protein n=1 Tax=Caenorhabditis brenneri TaxID=135651 RepID=G0NL80_CAEBE|nr:hypothetical protein CAEBREN_12007 [Caenorhabditis brenneri]
MFSPTTLLLLFSISFLVVDSSKIHDIVKHVGKRFENIDDDIGPIGLASACWVGFECEWLLYPEEKVEATKRTHATKIAKVFVESTSAQDYYFEKNIGLLETLLDPEMSAEVCGETNKMNAYQFMKYMRKVSTSYNIFPYRHYAFHMEQTDRKTLDIKVNVNQTDSFGKPVELYFDISTKLDIYEPNEFSRFRIYKIVQVGTCAEQGTVAFNEWAEIDDLIDDIEGLKGKPSVKLFFKLFTPSVQQLEDRNPNKLPRYWLAGLTKTDTKINVCREGNADAVEYTPDQFRVWYKHFGLMWYTPKDEIDPTQLQVIEISNNSIVARVTMKLQMGHAKDAKVHDWNFKFSAKKKTDDPKEWYIERLEVLCTPTVDLKDQSLLSMREVVTGVFMDNIAYLPDPNNTNAALSAIYRFRKTGLPDFQHFTETRYSKLQRIAYAEERRRRNITMYSKIYLPDEEYTLPAPDTATFGFWTISSTTDKDVEYENEWVIDIKWDEVDQVYLIEKLHIKGHTKLVAGEYGDKKYVEIEYHKRVPDPPIK